LAKPLWHRHENHLVGGPAGPYETRERKERNVGFGLMFHGEPEESGCPHGGGIETTKLFLFFLNVTSLGDRSPSTDGGEDERCT